MFTENSLSANPRPSRPAVVEDIKQLVADFTPDMPGEIKEEHALIADLGWDSLDMVEMSMQVEELYDIPVPDEMVDDITTVGDVVEAVLKLFAQEAE